MKTTLLTRERKAQLAHHRWLHPRRLLWVTMIAAVVGWLLSVVMTLAGAGKGVPWVFAFMGPVMAVQMFRFWMHHRGWAPLGAGELHSIELHKDNCPVDFQAHLVRQLSEHGWLSWAQVEALAREHRWKLDVNDGGLRWMRGGNPDAQRASVDDLRSHVRDHAWENGMLHAALSAHGAPGVEAQGGGGLRKKARI